MGCDCHGDCIPGDLPDESDLGQENEECQEVVRDGDRSKDTEKTWNTFELNVHFKSTKKESESSVHPEVERV